MMFGVKMNGKKVKRCEMGTYTGRNMVKDVTGAVNMIKDDWQLTKQCTSYNNEMLAVIIVVRSFTLKHLIRK